ncbi:MAG TPA: YciI family protein [Gemmatimonadales bacterium]|nr:YciI family protein [Gemmatimonadales bacterium]
MKYLCLIYEDEKLWQSMPKTDTEKVYGEYFAFTDSITKSGHYVGGNPLQPTNTATTVRVRNGKVSTTDGPFAETKEQLGGYYLVEAKDLNDAIHVAARIPGARLGSIEVRPIMEVPSR